MRRLLLCLMLLAWGAAAAPARAAGPEWEELILDGVRRQDSRLREVSIDAVVREQELLAARPAQGAAKVARLYLLGRALGKRAESVAPQLATKDMTNARAALREVLQLEPACYFAHRDLGILALKEVPPNLREAEANLQRALGANPSYVQALRDLARLCADQGRSADALVHLRRVIDLEPSDLAARALVVISLLELKRLDEARRDVDALLKSRPNDPMVRDLRAEVEFAAGNYDGALLLWRQLQTENPSATKPLWGQWKALSAKAKAGQQVGKQDMIDVVDRLSILDRDPAKRAKLKELSAELNRPAPDPNQPPDDATLQRVIAGPDEKARNQALAYVAYREDKPSLELLRAVMSRLDPVREPVPSVRAGALVTLARQGGFGLLGLVRHSLADPVPNVRRSALLAVESLAEQGDVARRSAFLILGLRTKDADPEVAAGARSATLRLAQQPPPAEELSAADERAAFEAWWQGPLAVDLKIRSLLVYPELRDLRGDQVLVEYLDDPDLHVVEAAYKALVAVGATVADPVVKEWIGRIPRWVGSFTPEKREEITRTLATWRAMRPPR
jgi:tetratricopeptide (TPR) repeat protein